MNRCLEPAWEETATLFCLTRQEQVRLNYNGWIQNIKKAIIAQIASLPY
jgi:hypothetical protein